MSAENAAGMTQTAYAKHRGISQPYVSRLIKAGRIPCVNGLIDPVAADAALEKSTDPDRKRGAARRLAAKRSENGEESRPETSEVVEKAPHKGGHPPVTNRKAVSATQTYTEMRAKRESVLAQSAELDYRQRVGQLCEIDAVARAVSDCSVATRRMIEQIPNRIAARIAATLSVDVRSIEPLMRTEIEHALDELANTASTLPERLASTQQ